MSLVLRNSNGKALHFQSHRSGCNRHILDQCGATYKNEKTYSASGNFEENIKKNNINEYSTQTPSLKKVDWVMGCSMLIDLDKFSSKKLFDENFFLYFEEFDLCKQIKNLSDIGSMQNI